MLPLGNCARPWGRDRPMRRIKVLHISQATGGVQRHVISLVSRLDKRIFEVVGCCPEVDRIPGVRRDKESFVEAFRRNQVRVIPIEMWREIRVFQDLRSFFKIYRMVRRERFDVVHTHSAKAGFLGRVAARLAGVPVVVHTPNNFAFDRPRQTPSRLLYRVLEKVAACFCDRILAVSPSEERLALTIAPRDKVVRIDNAVDVSEAVSRKDPLQTRRQLDLTPDQPVVSMVGRLSVQKSPKDFVLAAKEVLLRQQETAFLLMGDGPLWQETEDLLHSLNLGRHVLLLGWREDVVDLVALSDIVVLTSLWEGLPYSILDAMALKKPVVVTDATGSVDIVKNGVNGLVVPRGDPHEIAKAILHLLDHPAQARQMGEAGRRFLEKGHLSLPEHAARIQALYLTLLSQKAPRRIEGISLHGRS